MFYLASRNKYVDAVGQLTTAQIKAHVIEQFRVRFVDVRGRWLPAWMSAPVDSSIVSAMAAVLGSVVGGSASLATAWITQKTASKRELIHEEMAKREALYGEFIAECAMLLLDAFTHTLDKPDTLLPLYALINRIRLSASQPVLAEAENLLRRITEQYFSGNLTLEQMRDLTRSEDADPLKPFGEACRVELNSMRARV